MRQKRHGTGALNTSLALYRKGLSEREEKKGVLPVYQV